MQKTEVMYNRATVITDLRYLSYPVIFVLLIFSLLMAGCSDDENEEQPPAPDVPNYSTLVVKDIQNIPADFTFDRVEVKVTGVDWQVIETLSFPYENGQIVMTLPTSFGKATLVSYQYADRSFTLTGSDKSYYYSNCSFYKGWNIFANINPASEGGTAKVLRTTTVPESTLFWRLAESYVYN